MTVTDSPEFMAEIDFYYSWGRLKTYCDKQPINFARKECICKRLGRTQFNYKVCIKSLLSEVGSYIFTQEERGWHFLAHFCFSRRYKHDFSPLCNDWWNVTGIHTISLGITKDKLTRSNANAPQTENGVTSSHFKTFNCFLLCRLSKSIIFPITATFTLC